MEASSKLLLDANHLPDTASGDVLIVIGGTDGKRKFADLAVLHLDPYMAWRGEDGEGAGEIGIGDRAYANGDRYVGRFKKHERSGEGTVRRAVDFIFMTATISNPVKAKYSSSIVCGWRQYCSIMSRFPGVGSAPTRTATCS